MTESDDTIRGEKYMGVTSTDIDDFMGRFLSQLDDKGRELMNKYHPKIQVVDYGDLILSLAMSRSKEVSDEDYLYLLSSEPIVSHFWKIAEGTESPFGGYHELENLPRFIISCLFYTCGERSLSTGEISNPRTIQLTKSCYHLANAVVAAYETHGDGKIGEDDMIKIKDWLVRNEPVVKSSLKQ